MYARMIDLRELHHVVRSASLTWPVAGIFEPGKAGTSGRFVMNQRRARCSHNSFETWLRWKPRRKFECGSLIFAWVRLQRLLSGIIQQYELAAKPLLSWYPGRHVLPDGLHSSAMRNEGLIVAKGPLTQGFKWRRNRLFPLFYRAMMTPQCLFFTGPDTQTIHFGPL